MKSEPSKSLRQLLTTILIALTITILFVIIGTSLTNNGNAQLGMLALAPSLFIGIIVIYYVFSAFKSAGNLPWFFGGTFIILSLVLYDGGFMDVDLYIKNKLHISKLPKVYEKYQDVNNAVLNFENRKMKLSFESEMPIEHYHTKQNYLIVLTKKEFKKNDTLIQNKKLFKLDSSGNIVDTFSHDSERENEEVFFEGYLINIDENYYRTWALDGDTIKKKLEIQNENLDWNLEKQSKFIENVNLNATVFFQKYYYTPKTKRFDKIIYQLDGKWNIFYHNLKGKKDIDGEDVYIVESKGRTVNNLFNHYSQEDMKWVPNEHINIQSVYFQKIKLERIYGGGGTQSAGFTSDEWRGNLYTHLIYGTDTLKFKEELLLDEEWKQSPVKIDDKQIGTLTRKGVPFVPYSYYNNRNLNFQLFTNNERKLYIIK